MNILFTTTHMQTLKDLMEIAEKHNCKIRFNVGNNHSDDPNDMNFDYKWDIPQSVFNYIKDNKAFLSFFTECGGVTFELIECDEKGERTKTNYMTYAESSFWFYVNEDELPLELDKNFEEWYNHSDYGKWYGESTNKVFISGFKGVENYSAYRPEMALKFFGDMVCDYLSEPRIEGRVY